MLSVSLILPLCLSVTHRSSLNQTIFPGLRINLALCSGVGNLDVSIKQFTGEEGENCVWLKSECKNGAGPTICGSILTQKLNTDTSQYATTYRAATC